MRQVLGKVLACLVAVGVATMGAGVVSAEAVGAIGGVVWFDRNENRGGDDVGAPRAGDVAPEVYRVRAANPEGMVAARWYTDSDFVGTSEPVTEPFELPTASYEADVDVWFVLGDTEGGSMERGAVEERVVE
jgi:hypothetical protein